MFENIVAGSCTLKGCVLQHLDAGNYSPYAVTLSMRGVTYTDNGDIIFNAVDYMPKNLLQSYRMACTNSKVSPQIDATVINPPALVSDGFCKVFK